MPSSPRWTVKSSKGGAAAMLVHTNDMTSKCWQYIGAGTLSNARRSKTTVRTEPNLFVIT
eukprot:1135-Heterococcus_DN1.PRE.8